MNRSEHERRVFHACPCVSHHTCLVASLPLVRALGHLRLSPKPIPIATLMEYTVVYHVPHDVPEVTAVLQYWIPLASYIPTTCRPRRCRPMPLRRQHRDGKDALKRFHEVYVSTVLKKTLSRKDRTVSDAGVEAMIYIYIYI